LYKKKLVFLDTSSTDYQVTRRRLART